MIENDHQFNLDSISDHVPDSSAWDLFLEDSEYGHFQQSSGWAEFKKSQGWREHRCVRQRFGAIEGGYQMLWKPMRLGTLCYITKGPVSKNGDSLILRGLIENAVKIVSEKRLPLLIIQLPDRCTGMEALFTENGFVKIRGHAIINATAVIKLNYGIESIRAGLRRTTRQSIRQALRRNINIREGSREDLHTFFDLMAQTCVRQKTKPNPPSSETLSTLWDSFLKNGKIRLTIAENGGRSIAGLLCIGFGNTCTIWKKGSDPSHLNTHAMSLLYWEALEWARNAGYQIADFSAMSRDIAMKLQSGSPLSENEKTGRDCFNIGFGVLPKLLPAAYIWAKNPVLRFSFRIGDLASRVLKTKR